MAGSPQTDLSSSWKNHVLTWIVLLGGLSLAFTAWVSMRADLDGRGDRAVASFILAGGVLLSLFAAGLTWALVNSRARALQLASEMTESLRRAESEARRLALVASHTASVVILMDAARRIEWVNESFERFFGYCFE